MTDRHEYLRNQANALQEQMEWLDIATEHYWNGEWHEARTATMISQAYGALVNHASE